MIIILLFVTEKLTMYNMMLSTASESVLRTKACKGGLNHDISVKLLIVVSNPEGDRNSELLFYPSRVFGWTNTGDTMQQ